MSQDISILIKTKIDTSQQQITSLEEQIASLSSKIKTAISVKLNIDSKDIQLITEKIKEAQEKASSGGKKQIQVGDFSEAASKMQKMMTDIKRIESEFAHLGDNLSVKQVFASATSDLKRFEVSVEQLNGKIKEVFKFPVTMGTIKGADGIQEQILKMGDVSMASKASADKIIKDTNAKKQVISEEIVKMNELILLYKSGVKVGGEFITAANKMFSSQNTSKFSNEELQTRASLLKLLTQEQNKYNNAQKGSTNANTGTVNKEISALDKLILQYKALSISAEKFKELGTNMLNSMPSGSIVDLQERKKLIDALKIAQKELDASISKPKTDTSVTKEISEVDNLILKYKAATISAKEFMDAGNKLYDSGKLSGKTTADLQERARLIQALKGAEKEYYSSIGQESKNNLSIVNSAYTQQEQALKNIFALSKQRIDAEKNGYVELTTQLKEQIRLEGQKLVLARSDIKSNSLTNSVKEIELLNLKNNLQTDYNNKKSKEADITRQNLNNDQQLLKRTLTTMTADIQKFQRQYAGLYDSSKLNQITTDLKNLKISPNLSNDIANLKANFSALQKEAYATSSGLQQANKQVMSIGDALQTAGSKFGIWIIMSSLVMGVIHRITESFDYMLEQTKLFTNLQMEMTNQNLKFNEVTQSALDYAKAMGTTSSEVMKAISVFGTYTSSMDQVLERSEAAIVLSNISGRSILEVSDDLMAAQTQFKLGSNQLMSIVDTYASVARNLQVDFPKALGEISSGLKYVGSVAAEAKMPIQDLIAIQGTLVEVTRRSGSQISNGLKTIFSRIANVGEEANPEEFKKVEKVFYDMGISIKENADTIKPMNQILKETAERWKTLNDIQRQELATGAANMYQRNIFVALMNNFDNVLQNTESAYNSESVAMQKQDIYMKSLYASLQKLQNAFEQLYKNTISTSLWKQLLDGITSIMDGFNSLSAIVGGFPALMATAISSVALFSTKSREKFSTLLGSVTYRGLSAGQQGAALPPGMSNYSAQIPILNKIISSIKQINTLGNTRINFLDSLSSFTRNISGKAISSFNSLKTSIINTVNATKSLGVIGTTSKMFTLLGNGIKGATLALGSYITAANMAKIATIGLQTVMSMGMMVVFSLVIGQVFKLADSFLHAKEKQQELFESLKNDVSTLTSEISDSEKLIKTYNDLSQATSLTSDQKQKLADVTEKLSALYPSAISQFDAEGNAISLNSGKLQEYLDLKEQELNLKRQEMSEQFYKTGNKDVNNLLTNEKNIKSKMDQLAEYEKNQKRFLDSGDAKTDKTGYKKVLEDISRTKKELLELKSESIKITDELKTKLTATLQNNDEFKDFKPQELDNFISSLLKSQDVLEQIKKSGGIEIFSANLIDNGFASAFSNINKEFNYLSKNTNKTQKDIDEFNNNAVSKLTEKLSYLGNPVAENVAKVITDKFGLSISEVKEKIFDFNGAIESIQKTTTDTSDKIELYNQLLEKSKESNNDAAQEVMKHVDKHKDLYDVVDVENGMLVLNTSKLEDLRSKTIETAMVTTKAEIAKAEVVSIQTQARLAQYDLEIEKLNTLISLQNSYENISKIIDSQVVSGDLSRVEAVERLAQASRDIGDVYVANKLKEVKTLEDAKKVYGEWRNSQGYDEYEDSKESDAMWEKIKGYVKLKDAVEKANAVINSPNLGIKDSKDTASAKSAEALAWEKVTNEIKTYDNALKSLEDTTSNMIKGSKERRDALHNENLKIKEQIDYLKQQRDGLNAPLITNIPSTTTSTTGNATSALSKYKISPDISNAVNTISQKYNVDPALIYAIGQHETGWGKLGDGRKGMYTGYGSYDSGSDYGYSGLEKQITGTVKKMLAWGMTLGNVSLEKLNQGNSGNLPTGIYATDKNWQNNIWKYYKEFNNGMVTDTSSSKSELTTEKLLEDRIKHQEEINSNILELEKKFAQNSKEWYTDLWQETDNIIAEFEQKSNFSKSKSESMSKSSPEYRDELEIQKFNTTGIQKQLAEQAKQMDQAIENMKKGITEGTFKDKQFLEETIEKRKALSANWWNKQKEIVDKQAEITASEVEAITNKIDEYNMSLSIAQSQQEMNIKGTEKYNNALKNEIFQYSNIESALKSKQAIYQKELSDTALGTLRYEELQRAISDTTKEILDNQKALYDAQVKLADDIIELYKDAYEKQKDVAIKAKEKEMEAEEKRHKEVIDNLDDELDQYEDYINDKIKLLDKQSKNEDYNENLSDAQKEKLDLEKQINALSLDNSIEAKYKREELEKQLAEKIKEIQNMQKDHTRDLRKESLEEELDNYKDSIEEQKKAEDEKYENTKNRLDKEKEKLEEYWNNIINNERKYAKIREDILKSNFTNIITELTKFYSTATEKFKSLGISIQNNFIDKVKEALSAMQNFNSENSGNNDVGNSNGNSDNNDNNSSANPLSSNSPIATFDRDMYENLNGVAITKSRSLASALGVDVKWDQDKEQVIIGGKYFTPVRNDNGTTYVGIRKVAEELGHRVDYNNGIIDIFHEGGVAGGIGNSRIADLINNVFNKGLKKDELVSILQKGEPILSKLGVQNFIPTLQSILPSISIPNLTPIATGGNSNTYNLNLRIDNITGDKKGAEYVYNKLVDGIKKLGGNI